MFDMTNKGYRHYRSKGFVSKARRIKSNQSKPVMVMGKVYGSINEAETSLNLGNGSVNYWLKTDNQKAKEISREEYFRRKSNG